MITVNKNDFLNAIKAVKTNVVKAGLQPILSTIHIKSENGGLTLTATDCTNSSMAVIEANASEPIDVCLNADKLEGIVNRLGDEITLEIKDANALFKSGKLNYKLMYINATEFPTVEFNTTNNNKIVLSADEFIDVVNKTSFASAQELQNILSGVCFTFKETGYEVASTDGNRLSKVEYENPYINIKGSYTLPKKVLVDVSKVASDEVEIYLSERKVTFKTGNCIFSSMVLMGNFPEYNKLLPTSQPNVATINKKDIITALENVAVMADDKKNIVTLDFKGNVLELTTDSTDIGEAKDTIDVDFGKDLKIAFNYRYLVEVLKVIDTETVTFEMNTPLTACLIKSDFVHLIMPIQLRG